VLPGPSSRSSFNRLFRLPRSSFTPSIASGSLMASDHFYLFTAWASFSEEAQRRLQSVNSPQEIVALAAEKGYQITVEQLIHFSRRLQDRHWVWNQHDEQWARSFFARADGQPAPAWRVRV
jgi:hypothetical protein